MKTVEELRETILSYGFNAQHYSALINAWIDEAQRVLFRKAGLRTKQTEYSFTTEPSIQGYELPQNFAKLVGIRNTHLDPNIGLKQYTDINSFQELDTTGGIPTAYIVSGKKILLHPIPTGEETIGVRYSIIPSAIAEENSANPNIAEDYIQLIEEYVLSKCYAKEHDIEMSNFHKNNFDTGLVDFVGEMNTDVNVDDQQIEGAWPGYY